MPLSVENEEEERKTKRKRKDVFFIGI